jgi:DNA-binding response OmpR family regulator
MLSARFSAAGFKPLLATNGHAALETAMLMHPAIVLLDEQLPGLQGSQVCEHLASDRQTAHIPVIIITGHRRVASTPANLQMIVTKPFSAENLVATVVALIRRAKLISAA